MANSSHLHIALVTETFPPEVNGVALTVQSLEFGLRRLGHDVSVVRPRQANYDAANATPQDDATAPILVPGAAVPHGGHHVAQSVEAPRTASRDPAALAGHIAWLQFADAAPPGKRRFAGSQQFEQQPGCAEPSRQEGHDGLFQPGNVLLHAHDRP